MELCVTSFSRVCSGRRKPITSTHFSYTTSFKKFTFRKSSFHSTPPKRFDFQSRTTDSEEVDESIVHDGDYLKEKDRTPVNRSYEAQFYTYFPSLISKKVYPDKDVDTILKEIGEGTQEYLKLRKIYLEEKEEAEVEIDKREFRAGKLVVKPKLNLRISEGILEKSLPDGWGKRNKIKIDFDLLGEYNIYTRQILFDVIEEVKRQRSVEFLKLFQSRTLILNGEKGVGISTLLSMLAIFGRGSDWITVNISGNRITSDHNIDPSRVLRARYDQNLVAIDLLKVLLSTNGHLLSKLPLRTPLPAHLLDEGLTISKTTSLSDVIQYGIDNEESATDIFCYFRRELNLVTEYPVLIIVDDYNTLFNPAYYPDMHSPAYSVKRVAPEKLNIVRCFNDPIHTGLINGVMVCGTTGHEPMDNLRKKYYSYFYPVPNLSLDEVRSRCKYLEKKGALPHNIPDESVKYISQATGGLFLELAKYTKYAF